jgi:hypothetical protein
LPGGAPPCESCAKRVPEGTLQAPYGCAPFVAHALAAGGFVPRPQCGLLGDFSSVAAGGLAYDLNVVSKFDPKCGSKRCLLDYLEAMHWTPVRCDAHLQGELLKQVQARFFTDVLTDSK